MLSRLIGEKFEIKVALPDELPVFVRADEGGLEQILMNLVLNARDAMPNGGIVEISTDIGRRSTKPMRRGNPEARAGTLRLPRASPITAPAWTPQITLAHF